MLDSLILFVDDELDRHLSFRAKVLSGIEGLIVECHHAFSYDTILSKFHNGSMARDIKSGTYERQLQSRVYENAIRALENHEYDIVISDIRLQDTAGADRRSGGVNRDGLRLAIRIARNYPDVRTMLITAYGKEVASHETVLKLYIDGCIVDWVEEGRDPNEIWLKINDKLRTLLGEMKRYRKWEKEPFYRIRITQVAGEKYQAEVFNIDDIDLTTPLIDNPVKLTPTESKIFNFLPECVPVQVGSIRGEEAINILLRKGQIKSIVENTEKLQSFKSVIKDELKEYLNNRNCPWAKSKSPPPDTKSCYEEGGFPCELTDKLQCFKYLYVSEEYMSGEDSKTSGRTHIANIRTKIQPDCDYTPKKNSPYCDEFKHTLCCNRLIINDEDGYTLAAKVIR